MIGRILYSDGLKLKRTFLVLLAVLGPCGVITVNGIRYAMQYPKLVITGDDNWGRLLGNVHLLLVPTLLLGITLIASLLAGMEHQGHTWELLLALPVSKMKLYLGKCAWLTGLLTGSSIIAAAGIALLGYFLGIEPIPWSKVLMEGFDPFLAALPILAIQLYISVMVANQAIAITFGVVGVILSMSYHGLPHWLPWVYPMWTTGADPSNVVPYLGTGVVLGIVLFLLGAAFFEKKEVK